MELLGSRGNWYKGNLHMHTTVSDGVLTPKEAVARYREAGYDFVALTDHRAVNPAWEGEDFLVLSGAEYDTGDPDGEMPLYHIVGIGMLDTPDLYYPQGRYARRAYPSAQEIISAIRHVGGEAILAHPAWSVTDPEDVYGLRGLLGAEICNTYSGLPWNPGRADSSAYFDIWGKRGKLLSAIASDDSHRYEGEECRSFVMVNAPQLERQSVMEALRAGDFYASEGPAFYGISLEDGEVAVRCGADVETVIFYTNTPWGRGNVQHPEAVHGEETGWERKTVHYRAGYSDRYVRIELIDRKGRRAWSSPYAL